MTVAYVLDGRSGRRIGWLRETSWGGWSAVAFSGGPDHPAGLGVHGSLEGAVTAVGLAFEVRAGDGRPRVELDPVAVRIDLLAGDAF